MAYNNIGNYGLVARDALITGAQVDAELKIPRVATLPSAAYKGDIAFNAADNKAYFYDGTTWVSMAGTTGAFVPYTGAAANVDLGAYTITAASGTLTTGTASLSLTPQSVLIVPNVAGTASLSLKTANVGSGRWWSIEHTDPETTLKIKNVGSGSVVAQANATDTFQVNYGLLVGATSMFGSRGVVVDTSGTNYFILSNGSDPNASNRFFMSCAANTHAEIGCFSGDLTSPGWKDLCFQTGGGRIAVGKLSPAHALDVVGDIVASGALITSNGAAATPSLVFAADLDTGLYRGGANTLCVAGGGAQLAAFGSSAIVVTPQASTAFKVATNGGGWDALQVYSAGTNNADSNTIGYSAVMRPVSGGRLVLPSAAAAPTGAGTGEVYLDTNVAAVKVYNGAAWDIVGPAALAHITDVRFGSTPTGGPFGTYYYATFGQSFSARTLYIWSVDDPTVSTTFYVGYTGITADSIRGAVLTVAPSRATASGVMPLLYETGLYAPIGGTTPIYFRVYVFTDYATAITALSTTFAGAPERDMALTLNVY